MSDGREEGGSSNDGLVIAISLIGWDVVKNWTNGLAGLILIKGWGNQKTKIFCSPILYTILLLGFLS
jgi:hypothetical protein